VERRRTWSDGTMATTACSCRPRTAWWNIILPAGPLAEQCGGDAAQVAGLPPATGLWAAVRAPVIYAALGSSRSLSPGPAATTALMTAAAIGQNHLDGTQRVLEVGTGYGYQTALLARLASRTAA